MYFGDRKKTVIVSVTTLLLLIFAGIFTTVYQSRVKADKIYSSALEDFNKGDYRNAYYLFSKISLFSELKPFAIYHRADCARMLGDDKSEIKHYELLFNNYPKNILSIRTRYLAAQKLVETRPALAKKYFEFVIKNSPDTDYALASEYYLGVLLKNKYKDEKIVPKSVRDDVEGYFRTYLKKAPSGRHAFNAVEQWLEFPEDISKDDYLLMAKTCYLFGRYENAKQLLSRSGVEESWALDVKNSAAMKDFNRVKLLTEVGLAKYSNYVPEDEIVDVIDVYLANSGSLDKLLSISKGKGRDYLMNLNCQNQNDKTACYSNLYLSYPNGRFSADALSNIFFAKIKSGDVENAVKIGHDHLKKFPNSNSAPMVMFWLGKLAQRQNNYTEYTNLYRNVIMNYPDSYYAYRAYLALNHYNNALITGNINPKPVLYPYNYSNANIAVKLAELGDYGVLEEFVSNDDFIKSWILYKKGEYSNSMRLARDAMAKLDKKPDKYDLRWRLVYPLIYFDDIRKYSAQTGNNLPLMIALTREESYFDPLAQSSAGASGLMQLMPSTASEINRRFSLGLNISDALFYPSYNIMLGNYYYEFLRKNLEGYDISSVAAYNGGIGSIKDWKARIHYNDTDEFVEQIPYPETKNYVKKVFAGYWNYVRIYSGNE